MKKIGVLIKERRKAAGMTQKQLAQKIGKAEITIRQYESGARTPDLETKIAIANALNFSYYDFESDIEVPEGLDEAMAYAINNKPMDEEESMATVYEDTQWDDPNYINYLTKMMEERERGEYVIDTSEEDGRIVNKLIYFAPSLSMQGLTEEEVMLVRDFRDFLFWKKEKKQTGNS